MKIFVYGSLKRGFNNNSILKDSKFIDTAEINGRMYSLGAYPYVNIEENGVVHGEIYEVNKETLQNLDILEGYPHFYNRTMVNTYKKGACYVYHIDKKGTNLISSGMWS